MDLNKTQIERLSIYAIIALLLIHLLIQILSLIGLFPVIPFVSTRCCAFPEMAVCMIFISYLAYLNGRQRGQNNSELFEKSLRSGINIVLVSVVASIFGLLVIGIFVIGAIFFTVGGMSYLPHGIPLINSVTPSPQPSAVWLPYDGKINIATDKLVRTDPIVAIWTSADAKYGQTLSTGDNYVLVIYNDNTYVIYDRKNLTYKQGTWEKDPGKDSVYTLSKGTLTTRPEATGSYPSGGSLCFSMKNEGDGTYTDYYYQYFRLVDYYPLHPYGFAQFMNET